MRHADNQDAGAVTRRADGLTLLAVADGVSSSDRPDEASRVAVEAARSAFATGDGSDLAALARQCVGAAARAVLAVERHVVSDDLDPPETTVVLAVVRGSEACVAWVGDSRAYLLEGDGGTALTRDDSWAAETVALGIMSREAAMRDPRAHAITQCLGMPDGDVEVHVVPVTIPGGATLLLCSDGLWNYLDEPEALAAVAAPRSPSEDALGTCRRLVAHANACGGRDNVTVAVLRPATHGEGRAGTR